MSDSSDYQHREHDHLVEPMWSGLGMGDRSTGTGSGVTEPPEAGDVPAPPRGGLLDRARRLFGALLGRGQA